MTNPTPKAAGEQSPSALTIVAIGEGADADRWERAFRGVEGVNVARTSTGADAPSADAAVFAAPVPEMHTAIKRALLAGQHVFVGMPLALSAPQLLAIDASARARRRAVIIDNGTFADERIAFARKMVCGRQALWRPRYIRSMRAGASASSLDELAIADIGNVLQLSGGVPSYVTAIAPRLDDESGGAGAAMMTLAFDGGHIATIDVSTIEPEPQHVIVVACDGRTLRVDAHDTRAPLQIQASGGHRGPQSGAWAETISEHPTHQTSDRVARVADAFVSAVRSQDAGASNLREIADAALVWERARASIALGGERLSIDADEQAAARPLLRLIEGGGRRHRSRHAPSLSLIGDRPTPPTPLNSA